MNWNTVSEQGRWAHTDSEQGSWAHLDLWQYPGQLLHLGMVWAFTLKHSVRAQGPGVVYITTEGSQPVEPMWSQSRISSMLILGSLFFFLL